MNQANYQILFRKISRKPKLLKRVNPSPEHTACLVEHFHVIASFRTPELMHLRWEQIIVQASKNWLLRQGYCDVWPQWHMCVVRSRYKHTFFSGAAGGAMSCVGKRIMSGAKKRRNAGVSGMHEFLVRIWCPGQSYLRNLRWASQLVVFPFRWLAAVVCGKNPPAGRGVGLYEMNTIGGG